MIDSQLNGVITHSNTDRKTDYLYRVSLKAMIRDQNGNVLVVKEKGTSWWDLPGGGMDHDESMRTALARELKEEVGYEGDFDYRIVAVDEDADYVEPAKAWQIRLIFEVHTSNMNFKPGEDGEEVLFIDPMSLGESEQDAEKRIYTYALVGQ